MSSHFSATSAVVVVEGKVRGMLAGYRPPNHPDRLFVWQVAVSEVLRGRGVALGMLETILARPSCREVAWVETTVTPSNQSSRTFFERFAARRGVGCEDTLFLGRDAFGPEGHEEELLLRIGPLTPISAQGAG